MKRFFLCLLLLFSLFTTLAAQDNEAAETATEELNEQYELFSWEPVAKAKQYGVTIEKWDAAKEIWVDYKTFGNAILNGIFALICGFVLLKKYPDIIKNIEK